MHSRKLGTQGLEVSAIGLGTMGMAGVAGMGDMYGPADDTESIATIHRALDLGVNFFDTAEVYGPHVNEALLGRALAGRRHQAIVATKFGFRIEGGRIAGVDGSPENVRRAIDGSLTRLGVDHIDLWYQHRLDRSVPIEDTVGAMAEQVRAGKVRFLGLSEIGAATLARAHAVHPISALQSEYSLWERDIEHDVLAACRTLGVGIVPYSPLGRGFLTGTVPKPETLGAGDYRRLDPRFTDGNYERNLSIVRTVERIAARYDATPAQLALAWLLHQGPDIVPIPGTKRRRWLEANVAAATLVLETPDLAALAALQPTAGERYTPRGMEAIER
ncbi:MAG: Aldo-keto reductase IolS [Steroidobacteraceae bacterium]|nr:Aldo-keto reductase IolS [Steroidobacteraceae bacterium]